MHTRITINHITGGQAYGAILFEDGSSYPLSMPATAYEDLCNRGFFQLPADLPPDEDHPLNQSDIYETEATLRANQLEAQAGERLF